MNRVITCYRPTVSMIGHIIVALIVGLSLVGEVVAATISVPKDYATIQKAIDAASKGDKVQVSRGTYYENVTLKEGVTLEGGWNEDFSHRDIAAHVTTIDGGKKGGG
jgi:pectin methylesterase-like acyl-CoA thioesterase